MTPPPAQDKNTTYFAAKEAKETASILLQKSFSFYNYLNANAYLQKLQKMWRAYHGAYADDMGFGHQANSWMSADQSNQPLDANDINQLFDNDELAQDAAQTGVEQSEVRQSMAELLPQLFDSLTPNGDTQTESQANNEISDILAQLGNANR